MLSPVSATTLFQQDSHELGSHGYLRAGTGVSDGDTQICFKAAGASAKYRLGNECEVYGKVSLYYRHQQEKGGFYQHIELMPEYNGAYGHDVEHTRNVQAWIELGNIASSPVDVWIGRRYSKRRDIHINDYFYMNLWGEGFGVRNIPLGASRLAITYSQRQHRPAGLLDDVTQQTLDFSLSEPESNPGGKLTIDLRYAHIESDAFAATIHETDGWAVSLQHRQNDMLKGRNTVAIQYGRGAARTAWAGSTMENDDSLLKLADPLLAPGITEASTWRLLDYHLFDSEHWSMMSTGLIEWKDSAAFDGTDQIWTSLGVRPMFFLDAHWRVTAELGYDRVTGKPSHGSLLKQTIAAEWAEKRRFMSRPVLRAYLTHANWSDSYRGLVGNPAYTAETEGWSGGAQLETWW